jgi:putative cell wall-binding protein
MAHRRKISRSRSSRVRLPGVAVVVTLALVGSGLSTPMANASDDPSLGPVDPGPLPTEFALPNPSGQPNDVEAGADGSVWVSVFNDEQILRVDRSGTVVTTAQLTGGPSSLATDGAGGVWSAEYAANAIAHVAADGTVTEYPIPTPNSFPAHVDVFGTQVLFTESATQKLGRLDIATGHIDEVDIKGADTLWDVRGDSPSIFVTDVGRGGVWRLTYDGTLTGMFSAAGDISTFGDVEEATIGFSDGEIRSLNTDAPYTAKTLLSGRATVTGAQEVASGGATWFVDSGTNTFGSVSEDRIAGPEVAVPTPDAGLSGLAATEGRYLWSVEKNVGRLVRLDAGVAIDVVRVGGADRFELSANLARNAYPGGAKTVFVASGEKFPDALSAGPIAALNQAPVLLTAATGLPASVKDELVALRPARVIVVGGPASVSETVLGSIRASLPSSVAVERVGGADRYEVSRALLVHELGPGVVGRLILTTGRDFPDALSATPRAAAGYKTGVLLVDGKSAALTAAQMGLIEQVATARGAVTIVGGTESVSTAIETQLAGFVHTERIAGRDRFEVSEKVAWWSGSSGRVYLASGSAFADALAGGAVAAVQSTPLLLARQDCIPAPIVNRLIQMEVTSLVLVGGPATLGPGVEALRPCP